MPIVGESAAIAAQRLGQQFPGGGGRRQAMAAKRLCEEIILRFDMIIKNFYNDEDLSQGEIISTDRLGNVKHFALMSISIAVVMNFEGRYDHYGQLSRDAGEIKTCLKQLPGSNYMIDRRGRK